MPAPVCPHVRGRFSMAEPPVSSVQVTDITRTTSPMARMAFEADRPDGFAGPTPSRPLPLRLPRPARVRPALPERRTARRAGAGTIRPFRRASGPARAASPSADHQAAADGRS